MRRLTEAAEVALFLGVATRIALRIPSRRRSARHVPTRISLRPEESPLMSTTISILVGGCACGACRPDLMRRVQTVKAWRNCPPAALGSASSVPRGLWGYRVSAVLPRSGGARKRSPRCAAVLRTTTEVFDEFLRKARSCRDDLEPRWGRSVPVWHDGHDQGAQGSRGFLSAYGAEQGGGGSTLRRLHDAAGAIVERDDHDDDRTGQRGSPGLSSRVGPGLRGKRRHPGSARSWHWLGFATRSAPTRCRRPSWDRG